MPGIWQNATIFSLPARGIPVEISAVRLLYHIFERMWSHFWTEPRPARLHLFAADIVPVDRTTRERAASGSQNGSQRLAAARRDDVAEHPASQSDEEQDRSAIGIFAIIISYRIATESVLVA